MGRKKRIWGLGVQCGGHGRVMGQMWGTSGRGSILSLLWQRPANCCLLCRHGNACTPPLLLLWQHLPIKPIAMATSPPPSSPVATATPANQTHRYGNPYPLPPPVAMTTSILPLSPTNNTTLFSIFFHFFGHFYTPNPPFPPPGIFHLPPPNTFASSWRVGARGGRFFLPHISGSVGR